MLQAQLAEERRAREEMARKMEEDRLRSEYNQQQMIQWMTTLGQTMGQPLPPFPTFVPPPPPYAGTPVSVSFIFHAHLNC